MNKIPEHAGYYWAKTSQDMCWGIVVVEGKEPFLRCRVCGYSESCDVDDMIWGDEIKQMED
jgi:hypothetical protein